MADKCILVVGGAGYVGAHANLGLARRGYRTVVFDNLEHGHASFVQWGELVRGDLADPQALRRVFTDHDIAAVMHFAAYAYVAESVRHPAKYYRNNLVNTLNLLDAMRVAGVRHLIFSSSCATYGVPDAVPIPETHFQRPINPYGNTKLAVERMIADHAGAYDLEYVLLRYFNAAGADPEGRIGERHAPETHLIPLVLQAAAGRGQARVFGTDYETPDGTCVRDYIHVSDLADAHVLALEHLLAGRGSDVFNLGNGRGFSVREVIDTVRRVTGRTVPVREDPRRPGDPPVLVGDAAKAAERLAWRPAFAGLDQIIATAWGWHRQDWGL